MFKLAGLGSSVNPSYNLFFPFAYCRCWTSHLNCVSRLMERNTCWCWGCTWTLAFCMKTTETSRKLTTTLSSGMKLVKRWCICCCCCLHTEVATGGGGEMKARHHWWKPERKTKPNFSLKQKLWHESIQLVMVCRPAEFEASALDHKIGWQFKEAPSVLMLCAPLFIFTSSSSALLGRPRCGLSIWLSLLACHIQYTFQSLC